MSRAILTYGSKRTYELLDYVCTVETKTTLYISKDWLRAKEYISPYTACSLM